MRAFEARYEGKCTACDGPIKPTAMIVRDDDGGYRHEVCPKPARTDWPFDAEDLAERRAARRARRRGVQ